MKRLAILLSFVGWLITHLAIAQQGLKGEYFAGKNFDRKVLTRIDPDISFNWSSGSPGRGVPHSYFSARWTGKLQAPVSGQYRFYAKVDDGIRVWVGNKKVIESWQLNDSQKYVGSVILEAGSYYDLRVDYFNDMLEGEITLYWERPDTREIGLNPSDVRGEPISAKHFFQKIPPPVSIPKPIKTPVPVYSAAPPKTVPKKRIVTATRPKPEPPLPLPIKPELTTSPSPVTQAAATPRLGKTFILQHVQFEQSSYILQPESSVELDKLVAELKANPNWLIEIAGHTDAIGDPRLNQALSENRAKVVGNYLMRKGIDDARITTVGHGGTRPIADNKQESERLKNRRVEFTIK